MAAGIGSYLYTALQPVVLKIGSEDRQVQVQPRPAGEEILVLSPATEDWLRAGYARQMSTDAVRHDLGEILSHGEPACGTGQGVAAEEPSQSPAEAFWEGEPTSGRNGPEVERPTDGDAAFAEREPGGRKTGWCTSTSTAMGRTRRSHDRVA